MSLITDEKVRLRADAKDRRNALPAADRSAADQAITARVLAMLDQAPARTVAAYWPAGSEVDLRALMEALAARGTKVALPTVLADRSTMEFRLWEGGLPTHTTLGAIRQPGPEARMASPDLILVPLLAFDRAGNRLGYGRGFYDRALRELRILKPVVAVGVAYAEQEVARVPVERHDQRLDWIVTERGAIETGRRPG